MDQGSPVTPQADLKVVFRGAGRPLADAHALLEEHGIPCSIAYEGDETGYRLSVPSGRADEAMSILAAAPPQVFGWILGRRPTRPIPCPSCGSLEHFRSHAALGLLVGSALFAFIITSAIVGVAKWPVAVFFAIFSVVVLSPLIAWYHSKHRGARTCRECGTTFRV